MLIASSKQSGVTNWEQIKWLHSLDPLSRFEKEQFIDDGEATLEELEYLLDWYNFWKDYHGPFIVNIEDLEKAIASRK